MNDELVALRERVDSIDPAVGDMRDRLINCLQVASRPHDALSLARSLIENLVREILKALGIKSQGKLDDNIGKLEEQPVVPLEIISLLDLIRVMGNRAIHGVMKIEAKQYDVLLTMTNILRAVEWYYVEFDRGPRLASLYANSGDLIEDADPPYEVDLYEMAISIQPVEMQEFPVNHGNMPHSVLCDNVAKIRRTITFARSNLRDQPFSLMYSTRNNGYVTEPLVNAVNLRTPEEKGIYDDYGNHIVFRFIPEPGKEYTMLYEVYKGFDEGERNVHFHLHKDCNYRLVRVRLDLSEYRKAGYVISPEPSLFLHHFDPDNHDLCQYRSLGDLVPVASVDDSAIWMWEKENLQQGVIDLVWDLRKEVEQMMTP